MTTRSLVGLSMVGLGLLAGIGCNQIVGIVGAEEGACGEPQVSEDRVVGCMFRIACDPFFPPYTMSECVSMAWQDASPAETCTFAADSCADIDACIGRRYEPESSCTDLEGWSCDDSGERAIHCSEAGGYSVDCQLFGGTCLEHASTVVSTAYACQPSTPPTCPVDAEEGAYACEGSVRFTCIDGQPYGVDCAGIASDCIEYGPGEAFCSDRTESCAEASTVSCEGDVIDICDTNGYRVAFDCGTEGLGCAQDSESGAFECLAEGCETATECTERCDDDGKTLHFCAGGVPTSIDCTGYGYDGCVDTEIKGDVPLAYCLRATGEPPHP
jgi:hypothetical protein